MLAEIFRQAWQALRRNPARSLLTMAGIVWGIVAVVVVDRLRQRFPRRPGPRLRRLREERGGVLAGPDQRAGRRRTRRTPHPLRARGHGPHPQPGLPRQAGEPGNRALARYLVRRPPGQYRHPRRLPRIRRRSATRCRRRAAGSAPKISWNAGGWCSWEASCASSCSAAGPPSARPCSSVACALRSSARWTPRSSSATTSPATTTPAGSPTAPPRTCGTRVTPACSCFPPVAPQPGGQGHGTGA